MGILLSVPLTLPAIGMAKDEVVRAFILIFVGQIFLNMNWAIIVDVSLVQTSAETILTLKNRESIHFGFLRRGFVEKELIHDT